MTFHISRTVDLPFDQAIARVVDALKAEGFGVLTDIDIKATLKSKLNVDFRNYRILGACNPPLAHQALETEDKIGTMLPCNVVVQSTADGRVEVSAINPEESMERVDNPALGELAGKVTRKLERVIASLGNQ